MKIIRLYDIKGNVDVYVNTNSILAFYSEKDNTKVLVGSANTFFNVAETPEDIRRLIEEDDYE